jgi:acylphosphatase
MVARRLVIKGRVQGVGFRYFVHEAAQRLGVCGWVANRPDGSVEVHAETDDSAVMRDFMALAASGPPWSIVEDFDIRETEPQHHHMFRITR